MMLSDPHRAALLLVEQQAMHAQSVAYQRALDAEAAGDKAAAERWMNMFDVILELKAMRPLNGQIVH